MLAPNELYELYLLYKLYELFILHKAVWAVVVKLSGHTDFSTILPALVKGFDIVLFNVVPSTVFKALVGVVFSFSHFLLLFSQYDYSIAPVLPFVNQKKARGA
jgi:hypothetical protein